jgi:hypothetical protein
VSIGGRLPGLFRRAGLKVTEICPTVKTGAPGSDVWAWLTDYFLGVLPQYARFRPLDARAAARLRRHWLAAGRSDVSVLVAPTVLDVVGRKSR